jgi:hypothetical protein
MADLIGNEEELKLLRQENQTPRDQANLLQKTTRVQEETLLTKSKDLLVLASRG